MEIKSPGFLKFKISKEKMGILINLVKWSVIWQVEIIVSNFETKRKNIIFCFLWVIFGWAGLYNWEDALANLANFGWRSGVLTDFGVDGKPDELCEKLLVGVERSLLNNDGKELLAESGVLGVDAEIGGCALSPRISSRITFRQLISFASSTQRRTCLCRI